MTPQQVNQDQFPFAFPCLYDLDESVLDFSCDETVEPLQEKAGYWGWLKDLYINFEFFY